MGCPDLFLIRPPAGAAHRAVNPSHIVISGDSAGGGLSLALLQIIRDTNLPMPAGGVLVSPWCDFTHSFPSIHTNTATVSSSLLSFKSFLLTPVTKGCYPCLGALDAET
jgi:membrane-associated phospholipid phosphatase